MCAKSWRAVIATQLGAAACVTVDGAADMMWALMSWDVLERLTIERGWSQEVHADAMALLFRSTFARQP